MKPIIFQSDGICAILDGRKTQTRRICKAKSSTPLDEYSGEALDALIRHHFLYGKVGDKLRVKEGYQIKTIGIKSRSVAGVYLADEKAFDVRLTAKEWELLAKRKKPYMKTSGRFMYKSLIRLTPPITNIKVERVQDISEEDVFKEGCGISIPPAELARLDRSYAELNDITGTVPRSPIVDRFRWLWDSIHGKGAWDKNEWVWVVEFKRIDK